MVTRAGGKRIPEELIEQKKKDKAAEEAKTAKLQKAIRDTFSTAAGKMTLLYIMKRCGYQVNITSTNQTGELSKENSMHVAALHDFYVSSIRPFVDKKTLIDVEIYRLEAEDKKETKMKRKSK